MILNKYQHPHVWRDCDFIIDVMSKIAKIVKIKGFRHFCDQNVKVCGCDRCERTSRHDFHQKNSIKYKPCKYLLTKTWKPYVVLFSLKSTGWVAMIPPYLRLLTGHLHPIEGGTSDFFFTKMTAKDLTSSLPIIIIRVW